MVQIIEENRRPKSSEHIGQALSGIGRTVGGFISERNQRKQQQEMIERENEAIRNLTGLDIAGIQDPNIRQKLSQMGMEQGNQFRNQASALEGDLQNYNTIRKRFGQEFADVWEASPVGARTELMKNAIDTALRGGNISDMLRDVSGPETSGDFDFENIPQMKNGKLPKDGGLPELGKRPPGYTPKEWNQEKQIRRKENAPIFEAVNSKLDTIHSDQLATKQLSKLNDTGKLPEGLGRVIINPETGEIYGPAQLAGLASPEAQEWAKTIARFQNRAKDSFGARVTNFDLVSFMKQFPGLLNTPEGRKRILRMMDINYKLDSLHNQAMKNVFQHYGLSNISQEDADRLARGMIRDETEQLETEFLGNEAQSQRMTEAQQNNEPQQLSGRLVEVIGPDGEIYEVDESELGLLGEGFRMI